MKKVLFSATVDSHILQFHLPFLKLFKEKGYEVHVATNGDEEIPYCDVKHKVCFERSPFKLNNLKAIGQMKKICEKEQFDIIHTHTPMGSVVTRLGAIKSRKKFKTRVIYTAHGLHFFKGAPLKNWLIFYPVEKFLSRFTDTLILINQEDYDLCKRKFKKCRDIQYVPGVGIDEEKFNFEMTKKEKKELRESLGLKEKDFVMIYPAELSKRKRQIWLINSIEKLLKEYNDIHLLLPGKDSLNGECQKLVKSLGLENQIHFLGYRKDIPKLLKISDISVSAANQEGLPVNIMEAMYVGLPIVATDCRGNRDLVHDHINGYLINLNDDLRFSESIEKVYLSKDSNNKFSMESKYIVKEYLLKEIIVELNKIYFKKKKVLHVLASNIFSGAENVACTIIENLNDDYELYYCCPRGIIENILKEKKINYISIAKLNINEIKKVIKTIKPDVIHAHDYKASFLCSLVNKNSYLIEHLHNNSPWLNKISIYSFVFLYSSFKAHKILTVSDSIANEYIFSKFIDDKIFCIGNPVSRENVLKKVDTKNIGKIYDVCCVARITKQKNPYKFIQIINEIVKINPKFKSIWVGDGELKDDVLHIVKKLKLEDNISFIGFKSNPYKYMAQSKIFLLTSDWEGYGLVAFEALTLGLPCIVSNVGGLPNIVDNSCGLLCKENDDYIRIIDKLLNDNELLNKFENNAIKKSIELDNLCDYISVIKDIY